MHAGETGLNFGWPCLEGTLAFDEGATCAPSERPIHEYTHADGACSITGGVVARDPRLPALAGAFLFGDFCGGELRALLRDVTPATVASLGVRVPKPVSFGEDGRFRIHVATADGSLYRLDPAP